jgi:3-deoxy-D-manno-octulosonic-acid transferase
VAPDTRFDRVAAIAASPQPIEPAARFSRHAPTLVIGSAWPADLERIGPALARWEGPLRLVVAPHEVDEATLRQVERLLRPLPCLRYSQAAEALLDQASVLLIDNIGMLSSLYQYGKWAYIGGGFGKGLHNTLEAATFGLPVLFGPNHRKFREALELQEAGAAFSVGTADDFAEALGRLYGSEAFTAQASAAARSYVRARLGGTEAIMAKASALLS